MVTENRRDEQWLADIISACNTVETYIAALNKDVFFTSDLHKDAILYNLVIIGEACSKITKELREQYPDIPWTNIKDFRNYTVHEYFSLDLDIAWESAIENVPILKEQIIEILKKEFPTQ